MRPTHRCSLTKSSRCSNLYCIFLVSKSEKSLEPMLVDTAQTTENPKFSGCLVAQTKSRKKEKGRVLWPVLHAHHLHANHNNSYLHKPFWSGLDGHLGDTLWPPSCPLAKAGGGRSHARVAASSRAAASGSGSTGALSSSAAEAAADPAPAAGALEEGAASVGAMPTLSLHDADAVLRCDRWGMKWPPVAPGRL